MRNWRRPSRASSRLWAGRRASATACPPLSLGDKLTVRPPSVAVPRLRKEHGRLGINVFGFQRLEGGILLRSATLVQHLDIADLHIFDRVPRNPADDRAQPGRAARAHNVADDDALQGSDRPPVRRPQAPAQAHENGRADDVPHRNVGHRNVFQERAVHGFERQSLAAFEHAVGYGDVAKTAVGFRPELDAARAPGPPLVGAIEQRTLFPAAAHVAVGDGDELGLLGGPQRVVGFQTDAIVRRGIHVAIGDADVAAAVDVHAVAVGVDLQIVDG